MHKKRQVRTRHVKRNQPGLTRQEAHVRAKKAWVTKKNRYHFASEDQFDEDARQAEVNAYGLGAAGHVVGAKEYRQTLRDMARETAYYEAGLDEQTRELVRRLSPAQAAEAEGVFSRLSPAAQVFLSSRTPRERELLIKYGAANTAKRKAQLAQIPMKDRLKVAELTTRMQEAIWQGKVPPGSSEYVHPPGEGKGKPVEIWENQTGRRRVARSGEPVKVLKANSDDMTKEETAISLRNTMARYLGDPHGLSRDPVRKETGPTPTHHGVYVDPNASPMTREISRHEYMSTVYKNLLQNSEIQKAMMRAPVVKTRPDQLTRDDIQEQVKEFARHASINRYAQDSTMRRRAYNEAEFYLENLPQKANASAEQAKAEKRVKDTYKSLFQGVAPAEDPDRPKVARHDPRLHTWTAEEAYGISGHENKRGLSGWKAQTSFIKGQQLNRLRNIRSGNLNVGYGPNRKRVPVEQARYGLGPNKQWKYTLVDKEDVHKPIPMRRTKEQFVEYGDVKTKFHRGKRQQGKLLDNEYDEVRNVELVDKFQKTFSTKVGGRTLSSELFREYDRNLLHPEVIAERKVVVVPGLTRVVTKNIPRSGKTVQVADPRIPPAGRAASALRVGVRDKLPVEGQTRVYFVPPHLAQAVGTDQAALKIPGSKRHGVGSRLAFANFNPNETFEARIPGIGVGPQVPLGRMLSAPGEEQALRRQADLSRMAAWQKNANITATPGNLETHIHTERLKKGEAYTPESDEHLKTLAAAGVGAFYYTSQKRMRQSTVPTAFNKAIWSVAGKIPGARGRLIAKRLDQTNPEQMILPVKHMMRPLGERMADWKYMMRHPLQSPEGSTFGVEWGGAYYRKRGIDEGLFNARLLKRQRYELERVGRVKGYLEKHAYDQGFWSKKVVNQRKGIMRHKDYSDFFTGLDRLEETASQKLLEHSNDNRVKKEAQASLALVKKLRGQFKAPEGTLHHTPGPVSKGMEMVVHGAEGSVDKKGLAKLTQSIGSHNKAFAIGGGLIAAGIGAHYARHKYLEHKKPKEDRIAYYNKVLPPSFTVPAVPSVRPTWRGQTSGHPVLKELGLANRKILGGVTVKSRDRRITLRPSERGYDKNLPILGGLHINRGPGGSLKESVLFDMEQPFKRSYRPVGHEVYVGNKKVGRIKVGQNDIPSLSGVNPNRLTTEDREKIAYVYGPRGPLSREDKIKQKRDMQQLHKMYGSDMKLWEMMNDPQKMADIRKKHGTIGERRFVDEMEAVRKNRIEEANASLEKAAQGEKSEKAWSNFQVDMELLGSGQGLLKGRLSERDAIARGYKIDVLGRKFPLRPIDIGEASTTYGYKEDISGKSTRTHANRPVRQRGLKSPYWDRQKPDIKQIRSSERKFVREVWQKSRGGDTPESISARREKKSREYYHGEAAKRPAGLSDITLNSFEKTVQETIGKPPLKARSKKSNKKKK